MKEYFTNSERNTDMKDTGKKTGIIGIYFIVIEKVQVK